MSEPEPYDPYAATAVDPASPPPASAELARRIAAYSVVVSACGAALLGAALALELVVSLARFGGVEYVPRVVALGAVRSYGAADAIVLTSLTAVTLAHRAARRGEPLLLEGAAWWIGSAVAVGSALGTLCLVLGAFAVLGAGYGMPARTIVEGFAVTVTWGDVACGAGVAGAAALFAAALLPPLVRWVGAWRTGVLVKLVVVWAIAQAFAYALRLAVVVVMAGGAP